MSRSLPLLPLSPACIVGRFRQRHKRFSVLMEKDGLPVWVHSNNSGSMLGLTRPGAPLLASPAANPARKLPYTQEAVWLEDRALPTGTPPPPEAPFGYPQPDGLEHAEDHADSHGYRALPVQIQHGDAG